MHKMMSSVYRPTTLFPFSAIFTRLGCHSVWFLLNSVLISASLTGDFINTSDNAVLCYSCLAIPPLYANVKTKDLADHLFDAALDPVSNQTIRLPQANFGCRETHVTGQGQFLDTSKYICQTGACVKLKGVFQGEVFVVRECWDRLWERKYDGKWHGCAPVKFLAETQTEICVCSGDLCNGASKSMHSVLKVLCTLTIYVLFSYFRRP